MNKGHKIHPTDFKIKVARIYHIEKEYAVIILKELLKYGLIKDYSSKEIVFNEKADGIQVFLEED